MSFYENQVPVYRYPLDCGHEFRSQTPSVADADALHWFWCRSCRIWDSYHEDQVHPPPGWSTYNQEIRPRKPSGKRYADSELTRMRDNAVVRDRIRAVLLTGDWPAESWGDLAQQHGVSYATVNRVADDVAAGRLGRVPSE